MKSMYMLLENSAIRQNQRKERQFKATELVESDEKDKSIENIATGKQRKATKYFRNMKEV